MSPVYRYEAKDGTPRYRATVNVGYAQRKKEGFRSLAAAKEWQHVTRNEMVEGHAAGTLYSKEITVSELASRWLEHKRSRVDGTTWYDYETQLRRRILPRYWTRKLGEITPADLQDFLDELPSPSLVRKNRLVLRAMFRAAIGWRLLAFDPTTGVHGVPKEKREMRYLTEEEYLALEAAASDKQSKVLFRLAVQTGMRAGEIGALLWGDVQGGYIVVSKSYRRGVLSDTKTGRVRHVVIPERVAGELAAWKKARGDPGAGEYIFRARNGKPFDGGILTKRLARASQKAGIGHVHSHVLRHTYSAWVLTAGYSPQFLKEQLGHASIVTTFDEYGHLLEKARTDYREWAQEHFSFLD